MNVFLVVIDSFGIGALPDAYKYGDEGANTAAGIGRVLGKVDWPNLKKWGLGNAACINGEGINGCSEEHNTLAQFGVMIERSPGKDTTTGHWELAGIVLNKPLAIFNSVFPAFPEELIEDFIIKSGVPGILGNKSASGTVIIEELGEEHTRTGKPICYTSADSVFQIAAHESVYPIEQLYRICEIARSICNSYNIGRVIARPFEGSGGGYRRTSRRHDWSIDLPELSLLNHLSDRGVQTVAVGKISSIFNGSGVDVSYADSGNKACMARTLDLARSRTERDRFVFVNLIDTDMLFGHRRDPRGYHDAVKEIDGFLPELEGLLSRGDLIIVTGDHGCDPTFKGTDHTREYVPVLCRRVGSEARACGEQSLAARESFADVSASIQRNFNLEPLGAGLSFF